MKVIMKERKHLCVQSMSSRHGNTGGGGSMMCGDEMKLFAWTYNNGGPENAAGCPLDRHQSNRKSSLQFDNTSKYSKNPCMCVYM